jgi:hypothetical protein
LNHYQWKQNNSTKSSSEELVVKSYQVLGRNKEKYDKSVRGNGKLALQCSFKATSCSSLKAISRMLSDFIFKGCGFGDASTKKTLPEA